MSFWKELKRRNVYKVGVAYAIVAWLLIQAAAIIFPHLNLPSWAVTFLIVFLIACFPIALLLAWAYEVTPEGIKRTKEVPLSESITYLTGKKLNYILAGLLVLAIAFLLFDNYYLDRRAVEKEIASVETRQIPVVADVEKAKKTIAVLPFENLSSDPEQAYFVDGLSEEILNSLCQIPDFGVTGRTSSFSFKGSNKTVQEIASVLGVDNILEGSVRKAGNELRITAQLVRAKDDLHLWSKAYDRELKDIFAVQEDIAKEVANELKAALGVGNSFKQLGGTENVEAYELYLVAMGQDDKSLALKSIDASIALDSKFALAWAKKSYLHFLLAIFGPPNQASAEQDASINAALKAIELEPNLADAYVSLSCGKESKGDFIEAGLATHKALELINGPLTGRYSAIIFYDVGYFKRTNEILEEMRRNDPLNKNTRAQYMLNLAFLGYIQLAEEEYKRGKTLFGNQWPLGDNNVTILRIGSKDKVTIDDIVWSDQIFDTGKRNLESPEKGLLELRQIYQDRSNLSSAELMYISVWAAYFNDPAFAMDAIEKGLNIDGTGVFLVWLPVMHDVRQLPRFKEYLKKLGLVDYWNKFGWPDMCRPLDNGDFVCD